MHKTTFEVQKTLQSCNLQWNQLQCVTIDGGKNMAELKGLVGRIMTKLVELQLPKALFVHCIIHQQALCRKHLHISVVNFIQHHILNYGQFQNFLKEVNSEYCELLYHTAVRWLSCSKVLFCFYKLRREINSFLAEKTEPGYQNCNFC